MDKRKGQVYIQNWHISLRLKTIEADAAEHLGDCYVNATKSDSKKIDYIISVCSFSSNIFKNSFWLYGVVSICIFCVANPFINFGVGKYYLLPYNDL